jgi:hypothetical protein
LITCNAAALSTILLRQEMKLRLDLSFQISHTEISDGEPRQTVRLTAGFVRHFT